MVAWLDQPSLVPFLAHLPDGLGESFRESVVDRMIEVTQQPDGRCFEAFRRVNVSAVGQAVPDPRISGNAHAPARSPQ
jgi:trans-aconitate methyltransferase